MTAGGTTTPWTEREFLAALRAAGRRELPEKLPPWQVRLRERMMGEGEGI